MRVTHHRDGDTSLRLTRYELESLESSTTYGELHWRTIVIAGDSGYPTIDRRIHEDAEAIDAAVKAALEGARHA